jgi:hypothetical protein
MNARYIFHVITIGPLPEGVEATPSAEELVRQATERCLSLLEPLGVDSIAFPALGTGVARFSMDSAAAAMADVIVHHLAKTTSSLDVSLYLYARPGVRELDFITFYEEFARRQPAIVKHETLPTSSTERPVQAIRSVSKLLELERERQRLEQEIVLLRNHDGDSDSEADVTLSRELQANQAKRLEVAAQEKNKRSRPIGLFISYAREDEHYRENLSKHLSNLTQLGVITSWHDRMIVPGQAWDQEVNTALTDAQIVLFLVSSDFIASGYITGVEVARALERHDNGDLTLIPIYVRDVDLTGHRLKALQALPSNGTPISDWPREDSAYVDIVQGIRRAVDRVITNPLA